MKWLITLLLIGSTMAVKEHMLQNNRIPSNDVTTSIGTTCDECQSLVKRFVVMAKDPVKIRELKMLLNVLCHETSYVDECRVFVNNIDSLIKKLEPYLADSERVCKSIHMCSNSHLDAFRRIGLLYVRRAADKVEGMKDLVCDECQLAANELKSLVEDKEKQQEIREFFSKQVCIHAGSYRGMCDMLVEQFLPEVFQELEVILQDPKKACADIGFCASNGRRSRLEASAKPTLAGFWQNAKTIPTGNGEVLMSCLECKITADSLLLEAQDHRNEIAKDIQNLACLKILPANYTPSCEDFLSMYLPTIVYMTIKQYSGEGICLGLHSCDSDSLHAIRNLPVKNQLDLQCKARKPLLEFLEHGLVDEAAQRNAVAALQKHCDTLIDTFQPFCERIIAGIAPRFMNHASQLARLGKMMPSNC